MILAILAQFKAHFARRPRGSILESHETWVLRVVQAKIGYKWVEKCKIKNFYWEILEKLALEILYLKIFLLTQ